MKGKILILIEALIICFLVSYFYFYKEIKKVDNTVTLYGNVDIRQVDLGFRVYGKVDKLYYEEGDPVKPGDLLASLEKTPYQEQLDLAEAQVAAIEANLLSAELNFQRRKETESAISKEDLDNAFFQAEALRADVRAAQASLASKLTEYQDTDLICPSFGTILTRIREPGSVVSIGEPVYTVSLSTPIWIRAYVNERELGLLYPGMDAEVITDTPSLPKYHGKIGFISPVAEFTPKSVETTDLRTDLVYRLRIVIEDANANLRQGMPVTVKLKRDSEKQKRS